MSRFRNYNVAKNELTNMHINFVSLCGRGIHPDANVALFKSVCEKYEEGEGGDCESCGKPKSAHEEAPKDEKAMAKFLKSTKDEAVDSTVSSNPPTTGRENMPINDISELPDDLPAEVVEFIGKMQERLDEVAEADPVEKSDEAAEPSLDELLKSVDPAVAGVLRKQHEALEKAEARAADAERIAKAQAEARVTAECVEKASTLSSLGAPVTEVAEVLKALRTHQVNDEVVAKTEALLDAAAEAVATGEIFKTYGSTGAEVSGGKAEELAKAIKAASPDLTDDEALAKAYADNPALYTEYLKSKGEVA